MHNIHSASDKSVSGNIPVELLRKSIEKFTNRIELSSSSVIAVTIVHSSSSTRT